MPFSWLSSEWNKNVSTKKVTKVQFNNFQIKNLKIHKNFFHPHEIKLSNDGVALHGCDCFHKHVVYPN